MTARAFLIAGLLGAAAAAQPAWAQEAAAGSADRQVGMDQLTTSTVARRAQQRTSESANAAATGEQQVDRARRNVSAPGAISSASDSRASVAMVVGGSDRCDPAHAGSDKGACRDKLEDRSGEFAHSEAPTISPESALLAASQHAGLGANPGTGQGAVEADQRSTQELATVFSQQQAQQQAANANPATPQLDANQQAIVNAVVQSITRGN